MMLLVMLLRMVVVVMVEVLWEGERVTNELVLEMLMGWRMLLR